MKWDKICIKWFHVSSRKYCWELSAPKTELGHQKSMGQDSLVLILLARYLLCKFICSVLSSLSHHLHHFLSFLPYLHHFLSFLPSSSSLSFLSSISTQSAKMRNIIDNINKKGINLSWAEVEHTECKETTTKTTIKPNRVTTNTRSQWPSTWGLLIFAHNT